MKHHAKQRQFAIWDAVSSLLAGTLIYRQWKWSRKQRSDENIWITCRLCYPMLTYINFDKKQTSKRNRLSRNAPFTLLIRSISNTQTNTHTFENTLRVEYALFSWYQKIQKRQFRSAENSFCDFPHHPQVLYLSKTVLT